jgi:hypothetical protein
MSNIFYFFFIFAIIWEMICVTSPNKVSEFVKKTVTTTNDKRTTKQNSFLFWMFGYFFWVLVGLMSSQWVLFGCLLVLSLIPKKYVVVRFFDSILTFLVLLFIIINKYHLHIDLYSLLLEYFKG